MTLKTKVLKNGLRVLMVPMKESPAVTVMVLVNAGSFDEKKPAYGIAHFLEHMCFKGTAKRPELGQIARELEGLGAQTNAFTSTYFTGYFAKIEKAKAHQALEMVADIYLNPIFPEEEIAKERKVVLEELKMYEDHPMRLAPDLFNTLLYGDTPAGRPIIGYEKTILALSRDDLIAFRTANYHPEQTLVVVAGSFDERAVLRDIETLFCNLTGGAHASLQRRVPKTERIRFHHKEKKSGQTHLIMGVPALAAEDKDDAALSVLTDALGGGMSSRLFHRLREEMGLCYYIRANKNSNKGYGDLTISAGVPAKRLSEAVSAIREECDRIAREPIHEEELCRVKNHILGTLSLSLESSDDLAEYYGLQAVMGLPLKTPAAQRAAVKKVTAADVLRLAKKLFKKGAFRLVIIGPKQNTRVLEALL